MRSLLFGLALVLAWGPWASAADGLGFHLVYTSEVRGTVGICG
jgi:hypothetical protein